MSLVERLEKLAKEFDRQRWSGNGEYRPEKAEHCDLLREAAKTLRRLSENEMVVGVI